MTASSHTRTSSIDTAVANGPAKLTWFRFSSLISISPDHARLRRRGFPEHAKETTARLEQVARTFIQSANLALSCPAISPLLESIERAPCDLRGFAVEGTTFGLGVADAINPGMPVLPAWLKEVEQKHTYLAHVGLGWTLARVGWRRKRLVPLLDSVHRWLVEDGTGFHDCFFRTRRVLRGWRRIQKGYAARAYDHGVGRALWFATGGNVALALETVGMIDPSRRLDLLSGLGLAISYAGGVSLSDLHACLTDLSIDDRVALGQGAAFAAEAMVRSGVVHAGSPPIVELLTGVRLPAAVTIVRKFRPAVDEGESSCTPAYELWRLAVQTALRREIQGVSQ